jgi:hypothetical protein
LVQELGDKSELCDDALPQAAFGDVLQMAAEVTHDPAFISLLLFQCPAYALEFLGVGVPTNLQRKPRPKSGVEMPQLHPSLLHQRH